MKSDYQRQMDFYNPNNRHSVLIIGTGSTGSYLAFGLARMGVKKITVVDFDTVENHNLPNQFFSENNLPTEESTLYKVNALQASLQLFMPDTMGTIFFQIYPKNIKEVYDDVFKNQSYSAIFMAVDDMNVRKWLWTKFTAEGFPTNFIIDPRTGGEYANIFSIDVNNRADRTIYEENLWSNEDAAPLPCTGRAVIDVTLCVVGECIGRFRQAMARKLQVTWTFHSYNIGSSVIMSHHTLETNTDIVRDDKFVANVGVETVPEVTDGQS